MANLPRFGRTWPRLSSLPRPGSASRSELRPWTATTQLEAFSSAPTTTDILPTSPPPSSPKYSGKPPSPPTLPLSEVRHESERRTWKTTEKATKTDQHQQLQSDGINMEGENVGAVMHITQSSDALEVQKKNQSKENEEKEKKWSSNLPPKSFINTNFQSLNNSLMYSSSLSHRDPGLHLAFPNNPNRGDPLHYSTH